MTPTVTLRDVAAVAGVSVSTASRVLNGTGRAAPATRERIHAAAHRLGFRPNALARSFATGRSLTVGILATEPQGTFSMPVLLGAMSRLGQQDLATLAYDIGKNEHQQTETLAKLRSRRVDGLLLVGNGLGEPIRSVTARFPVPVVYAFGYSDLASDPSFLPDGRMAGRLAGEHLIGLGRRRIAHITAERDLAADQRELGLRDALADAGLDLALGESLRGDWTHRWGAEAVRRILSRHEDIDGIFCGDDWIALGAQAALVQEGARVPEDVAIVGFDNIGRLLDRPSRALTTIDPRLSEIGAEAATHLVEVMHGNSLSVGPQYQPCALIEGASTITTAQVTDEITLLAGASSDSSGQPR